MLVRFGCALVLVLVAALPVRSDPSEKVRIEQHQLQVPHGAVCQFTVVNDSTEFVTSLKVTSIREARDHLPVAEVRPAPPGWFAAWNWTGTWIWTGETLDVAIAPRERLTFELQHTDTKVAISNCDRYQAQVITAQVRPTAVEPARLHLELKDVRIARVVPGYFVVYEGHVELRNDGRGEALLNLGDVFNNRRECLTRPLLELSGPDGKTKLLQAGCTAIHDGVPYLPSGAPARNDSLDVPLQPGASKSYNLFWWDSVRGPPASGAYQARLILRGQNDPFISSERGVRRHWLGEVKSDVLAVSLP